MNSSKSSSFSTLRVVSSFSHSHSSFLVKLTLVTLCNASSSCGISHRRINIGTYFFCGLPASLEKWDYIINVFGSHSEFLDQRFFVRSGESKFSLKAVILYIPISTIVAIVTKRNVSREEIEELFSCECNDVHHRGC